MYVGGVYTHIRTRDEMTEVHNGVVFLLNTFERDSHEAARGQAAADRFTLFSFLFPSFSLVFSVILTMVPFQSLSMLTGAGRVKDYEHGTTCINNMIL